jgi:hypothetical protein
MLMIKCKRIAAVIVSLAVLVAGAITAEIQARTADSPVSQSPSAEQTGDTKQASKVTLLRTPGKGIQPQVAADDKGVLHLIYFGGDSGDGDIFYVRSEDGGSKFSHPLRVNSQPGSAIATGNIRGAHLALGKKGRVHVAWMGSSKAEPRGLEKATPMLYTRLNDDTTAFEPQRNVVQAAVGLDGGGSLAADGAGNVYVAWHAPEPLLKGEENRRVWVAISSNDGNTFAREKPASPQGTGACGCCGMRAFGDRKGNLYMLYRSAAEGVNRDTYLLTSKDRGNKFQGDKLHAWNIATCPMSSYSLAETSLGILAAWETDGQVYHTRIDPTSGKHAAPQAAPGAGKGRKHPVTAGNAKGETILVWTEGMGWNRGGSVAWQLFDKEGRPTAERGHAEGVPTWSLVAVFTRPDGGFTIIY